MFESKNINDPYKFIEELYNRLNGLKNDIDNSLKSSYPSNYHVCLAESNMLQRIIDWIDNYGGKNED